MAVCLLLLSTVGHASQGDVLHYHNDAGSTGQYLAEPLLSATNVNATSFGRVFSYAVDGQVYAQPLYKSQVTITTGSFMGVHNVIYVATENDSVYAFDASGAGASGTSPLWQTNFLSAANNVTTIPSTDTGSAQISPQIGITSTPAIDPSTNTIFVCARTKEIVSGSNHYVCRLHALDLGSGAEKPGSPVVIGDTISNDLATYTYVSGPSVSGTGAGAVGGVVTFNALREGQWSAVSWVGGNVYIGFASLGNVGPFHGWVLGFSGTSYQPVAVWNADPNGSNAGIWEGGGSVASDPSDDLYVMTGNGTYTSNGNYGESFLKLGPDTAHNSPANPNNNGWGLKVYGAWTPPNQAALTGSGLDLGSGGPMLLPNSVGTGGNTPTMIGAGQQGTAYLVNCNSLANLEVDAGAIPSGFSTPAYFNGNVYFGTSNGAGVAFPIASGSFSTTGVSTPDTFGFPGGSPSISGTGANDPNAIVWWVDGGGTGSNQLRAYLASNISDEIYNSAQAPNNRDVMTNPSPFAVPTIASSRVYVGTGTGVVVYGLLALQAPAAPANPVASGDNGYINITWSPSNGATSYNLYRSLTSGSEGLTPFKTGITSPTYNDSGVTPGLVHYYTVSAVNAGGVGPQSAECSAASLPPPPPPAPAAPANPVASGDNGYINITWSPSSGATSYDLYRSLTSGSEGSTPFKTGITSTTYNDSGVTPGLVHYYTVSGVNAGGAGPQSTECSAASLSAPGAPAAPANPVASGDNGYINITWSPSSGATSYDLYRSLTSGSEGSTPYKTGITSSTYNDTGVTPGLVHYYTVSGVNAAGTGPQSTECSAAGLTGPAAPANPVATGGAGYINITWSPSSGATSYDLYRSLTSGSEGSTPYQTGITSTTYNDIGVTPGLVHYYTVSGVNAAGAGPQSTQCAAAALTGPPAPANPVASGDNGYINITWSPSNGATSYNLYRSLASGSEGSTPYKTGISSTTYNDIGVTPGLVHYYTVSGVNAAGAGPQSTECSAAALTLPAAPTNPSATGGQGYISLSWNPSVSATSYNLFRALVSGSEGSTPYQIGLTSTNFTDTFVANATTYYYTVNAVNSVGASPQSVEFSALTLPPPAGSPAAPTNLSATGGQGYISLSWNPSVSATSYNLYRSLISGGESSTPYLVGLTSTNFTDTFVANSTTYYYTVSAANSAGTSSQSVESSALTLPAAGGDVLCYHNDAASTGQYLTEPLLSATNVNSTNFGELFNYGVDGLIIAQVLYKQQVPITTGPYQGTTHNVIFVSTEYDSIFAFDADGIAGSAPLWHTSFINPANNVTPVPNGDLGETNLAPWVGITGTPVIDPTSNTLFACVRTKEIVSGSNHYIYRLHALDLGSGAEKPGSPVLFADTIGTGPNYTFVTGPAVSGTGDGFNTVTFNGLREAQRPGLSLVNGVVYAAFASVNDATPFHGWVLGFSATNYQLVAAWNTTTNGFDGGIWQGGGSVISDSNGYLYFMTGNGKFIPPTYDAPSGSYINGNYGDSFVGLAPDTVHNSSSNQNSNGWGLKVITYFTPANQAILSGSDLDLGSGGPMLLPDSVGSPAHPHLIVGAGKQGTIYMVDRDNMGGGNYSSTSDMVVQEDLGAVVSCYTVPAYFNGAFYMMSTGRKTSAMPSTANAFTISSGSFSTTAVSTPDTFGYTGSSPCISGTSATDPNAIVWCLDCGPSASNQLRAYCASNFSQEIYTTAQAPNNRDSFGIAFKYTLPTVANSRVYVSATNTVFAYGLLAAQSPGNAPAIASNDSVRVASSQLASTGGSAGSTSNEDGIVSTPATDGSFTISTPAGNRYTFLLRAQDPGAGMPQGIGYGTITVKPSLWAVLGGKLPDGEGFSTYGYIVTGSAGDQLTIHKPLSYPSVTVRNARGLLSGTFTFVTTGTSDVSGTLTWSKPAQKSGLYQAPISSATLDVIGSVYVPPAAKGDSALPGFTTGTLTLGDTSGFFVAEPVTLSTSNSIILTGTDKTTLTINPAVGTFKGSFHYLGQKKPTNYQGVLDQDQQQGGGLFLGPMGSGTVNLSQ